MPGGNPGRCAYCGRRILFVKMKSGKSMPVDEEFVNYKKVKGGKERVVTPSGEVVACTTDVRSDKADGYGYISHFATCTAKRNTK